MELQLGVWDVADAFEERWGVQPPVIARVPGRVNLIGEHIDYEGYGVLPMAIDEACVVAAAWRQAGGSSRDRPARLLVANLEPERYPDGELPLALDAAAAAADPKPPSHFPPSSSWLSYVAAAHRGCLEFAAARGVQVPAGPQHAQEQQQHGGGYDVVLLVGSSVPAAAGLSSSSALVVATALALLKLWELPASRTEVAELTCRCERFVGTQGGGMDQAVALLAQPSMAVRIDFNPVRARPVPLPAGATIVVANSLTPSAKAETAAHRFNRRVMECRLAAVLLAKQLAGSDASSNDGNSLEWQQVSILQQVEPALRQHGSRLPGAAADDAGQQLAQAVLQLLPQQAYQLHEVAGLLGAAQEQLLSMLPPALQAAAQAASQLQLQQRALHVFAEAQRVDEFEAVCRDASLSDPAKLARLGALLNASHASCAGLYECSCDELDRLVGAARAAGALGARLTGAGWGGCTVSLVREEDAPRFIAQLREAYFMPLVAAGVVQEQQLPECLFASKPACGAIVMRPALHPKEALGLAPAEVEALTADAEAERMLTAM